MTLSKGNLLFAFNQILLYANCITWQVARAIQTTSIKSCLKKTKSDANDEDLAASALDTVGRIHTDSTTSKTSNRQKKRGVAGGKSHLPGSSLRLAHLILYGLRLPILRDPRRLPQSVQGSKKGPRYKNMLKVLSYQMRSTSRTLSGSRPLASPCHSHINND